jgi:hypothetical protein
MIQTFVQSRFDWDCGVATVAMVTNRPYEFALEAVRAVTDSTEHVTVADMAMILSGLRVNGSPRLTFHRAKPDATIKEWAHDGWPVWSIRPLVAMIAPDEEHSTGHWVVIDGGRVFDPANEKPVALREYDRLDWWAVWFAAPSFS